MDYQARLTDILEKVRKGGVYDVMPEYERQSDYMDTDEAQEAITALFLSSVGKNEEACNYKARLNDILTMLDQGEYLGDGGVESAQEDVTALFLESVGEDGTRWSYSAPMEMPVDMHREGLHRQIGSNQRAYDIRRKWQTNQEDGE